MSATIVAAVVSDAFGGRAAVGASARAENSAPGW